MATSPSLSASLALAFHLRTSFLTSSCCDVRLRIPSWSLTYQAHRVVLARDPGGFFHGVFCEGFAGGNDGELAARGGSTTDLDLSFPDPRISRAAFEYCLATLYAIDVRLVVQLGATTSSTKLAATLPNSAINGTLLVPATPTFLLSVLTTALYLGQDAIASEALGLVLGSVERTSVIEYLAFARGGGEPQQNQANRSCPGLESLAKPYQPSIYTQDEEDDDGVSGAASSRASSLRGQRQGGTPPPSTQAETTSLRRQQQPGGPTFFYGPAASRVGEACAAWLCRWAVEVLELEERELQQQQQQGASVSLGRAAVRFSESSSSSSSRDSPSSPIWAHGGLPADWIRVILSSDSLFVQDEEARYDFAKRVVALRRRSRAGKVSEDDEEEEEAQFAELFRDGIYYSHMVSSIHRDDSSSANRRASALCPSILHVL